VRLFGESDYDAYQRLKKLEILEPEIKVSFAVLISVAVLNCLYDFVYGENRERQEIQYVSVLFVSSSHH